MDYINLQIHKILIYYRVKLMTRQPNLINLAYPEINLVSDRDILNMQFLKAKETQKLPS